MIELVISKSTVGPLRKRYNPNSSDADENGYEKVPKGEIRKMVIMGLDGSHNRDYEAGKHSDPLITIKGGPKESYEKIKKAMDKVGFQDILLEI